MTLPKRIKKREGENLSNENVRKVIFLLERENNKITKKEACELLNIPYNTTRLGTIIENYKVEAENTKNLRAKRRGKPPTNDEIANVIKSYLEGSPVSSISDRLYRPPYFVNNILITYGVPIREPGATFFKKVSFIPDSAVKEEFSVNEIVYSARYHSLARIVNTFTDKKKQKVYSIYILGDDNKFMAYQPAYELASLDQYKSLGIVF
jgi:hypothetical protein